MRTLIARLFLVLAGTVLGVVGAEATVRVIAPQPYITGDLRWEAHPTVGFRLQPNIDVPGELGGSINRLGLRGPEIHAKEEGERRVMVLGDSFVYGVGVTEKETFPSVLNEIVADHESASRTHFVNAGTIGYGTWRELAWLEAFGDEVDPDEVLLALFVGNDFVNNVLTKPPAIVDGKMVRRGEEDETQTDLRLKIWKNKSHIYRWWRRYTYNGPTQDKQTNRGGKPAVERGLGQRIGIYAAPGKAPKEFADLIEDGYTETVKALDGVKAWCDEREVALRVVIVPDILQIDGDVKKEVSKRYPSLRNKVMPLRPQWEVMKWCEERGVSGLDLVPLFTKETQRRGESLYLGYDPHWNEDGHAFVADTLSKTFYSDA